jgi:hypothetical protein
MAARALFPELHAQFPNHDHPEEAAFIAITRAVAPVGMLGLLRQRHFPATMSAMDAGLNEDRGHLHQELLPARPPAGRR